MWDCSFCGKKFTTKYFLKKHRRLHTGETPYSCNLCGKTFAFQQSFHKHMLYHTDEKPYTCTWKDCGKAFKELSTLQNHERIHSGERPFVCETCNKSFRQRVSYLVHRRIHTGVLPYTCTACGKKFRYKVTQRTHRCRGSGLDEQDALANQEEERVDQPSPRPLAEDTALMPVSKEIEATLEQFRMARGRRQLGNRLQDILARQAKKQEENLLGSKQLVQVALQPPEMSQSSRTEGHFVSNGQIQDRLAAVQSQSGLAGGTLQGLLLGGVQDQGGALAVDQLQALTLDENQLSQQMSSPVKSREATVTCAPSPLTWAEALGQVGQVDVGTGWEGGGQEASSLFQELATLQ